MENTEIHKQIWLVDFKGTELDVNIRTILLCVGEKWGG
jgi:hypothetical protein